MIILKHMNIIQMIENFSLGLLIVKEFFNRGQFMLGKYSEINIPQH